PEVGPPSLSPLVRSWEWADSGYNRSSSGRFHYREEEFMSTTLTSGDRRVIAIAVLLSAISLAVGVKYFSHAFPEAAIEFRVNRDDSIPMAQEFLAKRGWSVQGYRNAAVFDYDDDAKVYLERTQGLGRMNTLTRGPVRLWRWSHRWFRPQQKEEFRVDISPAGEV